MAVIALPLSIIGKFISRRRKNAGKSDSVDAITIKNASTYGLISGLTIVILYELLLHPGIPALAAVLINSMIFGTWIAAPRISTITRISLLSTFVIIFVLLLLTKNAVLFPIPDGQPKKQSVITDLIDPATLPDLPGLGPSQATAKHELDIELVVEVILAILVIAFVAFLGWLIRRVFRKHQNSIQIIPPPPPVLPDTVVVENKNKGSSEFKILGLSIIAGFCLIFPLAFFSNALITYRYIGAGNYRSPGRIEEDPDIQKILGVILLPYCLCSLYRTGRNLLKLMKESPSKR
jgi:hypothetical protein